MMLKKTIFTVLMIVVAVVGNAQSQMMTIPADEDVRTGKLANGLTYYIRYNNWPEHRAEFHIAQKVGSIQENDDQRGLAHFLEHMCFNGTKNFPGDKLLRWCESIGVQFGTDLNAYTSIDETVYRISNVPTERQSVVDSCLLILCDWADGLVLDSVEIDKERGVINEEWRMRTRASMRMLERNLPAIYPGSKYGHRMPIGLMEVVNSFKPQVLRDYYEKWYRPDNQAIIVVGDIDVDYVENKIKSMFGGIVMPENPAPVVMEAVPDNDTPIIIIDKDKEQRANTAMLFFKTDAVPDSVKNSMVYLMGEYVKGAAFSMVNYRLAELSQKADCPYVSGSADYSTYMLSRPKDAVQFDATPRDGQTVENALAAVYREALRASRFGITPTEYDRYKADVLSSLDKAYSNRDKRYNSQFVEEYKQHFLNNEPYPSIDFYYQAMKQIVPMIPLEAINGLLKKLIPENDSNMVLINYNIEKEGATYPTEQGFLDALHAVRAEKLEAYVDNVKNEPLIKTLPAKGKITKETENELFGYKELTLSNGARVILKKTDYKKDQVTLYAEGFGGYSLYGEDDFLNIKVFNDVIESSGLGNFSSTELPKALAGKIAEASLGLSSTRAYLNGSSTPTDVETMLQLVYLYFTNIKKDQESFESLLKQYEIVLKNKKLSPDAAFSDSLSATFNCHNPRWRPFEKDEISKIDYDRILQIAKEATANASAFTFTIVGNYDEETIRPLIEQYVASLPSTGEVVKGKDISTPFKGVVINHFKRKMETPKANAVVRWADYETPYNLENGIKADMIGQVLSMVYLKKIREDAGAAYSCGADGNITKNDFGQTTTLMVYCPVKPEMADTALTIIRDEMENITTTCDADMLKKVKEYMLKNYDDQIKTNGYWMGVIDVWTNYGIDIHSNFKEIVEAQTPATISAFAKQIVGRGNRAEVVMLPEVSE